MHSIEQGQQFHIARRIAKLIAPEFRVFATEKLGEDECVLDLKQKTIEVGEETTQLRAVAAILFQVGHLRLMGRPDFKEHMGQIQPINEKRLVGKLVRQGAEADRLAGEWALEVLLANFSLPPAEAEALIRSYMWDLDAWRHYYSMYGMYRTST